MFFYYINFNFSFSCCVDENAAKHIGADAVIHFGRCCLSPSEHLPVLYSMSPKISFDVDKLHSVLENNVIEKNQRLILTCDARCHYALGNLYNKNKLLQILIN